MKNAISPTMALPTEHCTPQSRYLAAFSSAFHVCVPTDLAFLSTALGICSIISWLFAQAPQVYKNYKLQAASGLSIYFLIEWMLGDLTNLLGALLTEQAAWQVVVAVYYVLVDLCLVVQYIWYVHGWGKIQETKSGEVEQNGYLDGEDGYIEHSERSRQDSSPDKKSSSAGALPSHSGPSLRTTDKPHPDRSKRSTGGVGRVQSYSAKGCFNEKSGPLTLSSHNHLDRPCPRLTPSTQRMLTVAAISIALVHAAPHSATSTMSPPTTPSSAEFAGQILSWISTLLYLGSRLPQIYKNARRRSTSGLSPSLFIAAFFGNLFYSTSIITNPLAWGSYPPHGLHGWVGPEGSDRATWVELAAPFWLGAAGVLFMDAIIGLQFLSYGEQTEVDVLIMEDGKGKGRFRRVSGWMRGWIPHVSVRAKGAVDAEGEGRPLIKQRSISGRTIGSYGAT